MELDLRLWPAAIVAGDVAGYPQNVTLWDLTAWPEST